MKNEIWKDCKHYEGLYQVSNYGRVKSLERDIVYKDGRKKHLTETMLKFGSNGVGYSFVYMSRNGKAKKEYVHRLVAMAFIPNPENKPQVNHIDENPMNNYVGNLEWVTSKENINYGNHNAKLSYSLKCTDKNKSGNHHSARKTYCEGRVFNCMKDCALFYGVVPNTMNNWLNGRNVMPQKFIDMNLSYV